MKEKFHTTTDLRNAKAMVTACELAVTQAWHDVIANHGAPEAVSGLKLARHNHRAACTQYRKIDKIFSAAAVNMGMTFAEYVTMLDTRAYITPRKHIQDDGDLQDWRDEQAMYADLRRGG